MAAQIIKFTDEMIRRLLLLWNIEDQLKKTVAERQKEEVDVTKGDEI